LLPSSCSVAEVACSEDVIPGFIPDTDNDDNHDDDDDDDVGARSTSFEWADPLVAMFPNACPVQLSMALTHAKKICIGDRSVFRPLSSARKKHLRMAGMVLLPRHAGATLPVIAVTCAKEIPMRE